MKKAMRIGFVLFACAILADCSTTPAVNKSRTYNQSFDETWDHAIRYLSEHKYDVRDATKEKGIIRAYAPITETLKAEPKIAECFEGNMDWRTGSHSQLHFPIVMWPEYDLREIALSMLLLENGPTTAVTIDTQPMYDARATCFDYPYYGSCEAYGQCASQGFIETQILNSL